ncbi:MAG: adenosylcobinamide-GDP ribazoletransferase [Nitrososphaeria archaeon]|nr:adenosylcobinamide-GDP ribazoletransferase [Nitrososphaeria archaeon]NDB62659.1 adenosylcobinamide-GDP ribazoletransferase [Nitrosopumilaceae archaeon]NDB89946.1 adenosylcobinamide-GDP ribazoletransferase [Nitrososphaerota archaeon]NDF24855.1 adenosylcobinamide-GDP ribazoletransferase [Nitrososphaerota archaeon]
MFRQAGSVFSFLTIIPSGSSDLQTVAKHMYLFPVIGIAIGLLIGAVGWGLSFFLEPLVVGLLVAASLVLITGIHHTDGLSDFADGLMVKGSKEKKLEVMRDPKVGSAGIVAIVFYVAAAVIALSFMKGFELFYAILIGEVIAKFCMVLSASIGPSAWQGSNSAFIESMKDKKKLVVAGAITISVIVLFQNNAGFVALAAAIAVTLVIVGVSKRSFGGISGDIMGAINELARVSSFLVLASL